MLIEYCSAAKRIILNTRDLTIESLLSIVKKELSLPENDELNIQIFDSDFKTFCDMENICELKHLSRLKINKETPNQDNEIPTYEDTKLTINEGIIMDINLRKKSCTDVNDFNIPLCVFSQISREELALAKEAFEDKGKLHTASYKLKVEIHDILSKEVTEYGLYPTYEMYTIAAKKLIKMYPFLKDSMGEGFYCWKIALKYRVQEIRRRSNALEATINSGKKEIETILNNC